MELEHDKDFQKKVNAVRGKFFKADLKGCNIRAYLDVSERKNSKAKPLTLRRVSAVEKLELSYDLVMVGRQTQLAQMTDDAITRWMVRLLGRVDEKDGVFTVKAADLELSRAELEHLGPPEELEKWSQGRLFPPPGEAAAEVPATVQ